MTQSPCEMREPSLQPLRTILKRRRRCPEFLEQRRCILPTLFTGADLLNRALVQHCAVGEEVHGSRFSSSEEGRRSRLVADSKMPAMNDRSIHPGSRNRVAEAHDSGQAFTAQALKCARQEPALSVGGDGVEQNKTPEFHAFGCVHGKH